MRNDEYAYGVAEAMPDQLSMQAVPASTPGRVILFVDDEPDILSSLKMLLEVAPGVRVITAPSGSDGLAILMAERIDLIISDFRMPRMDGMEFLARARQARPEVPRIMYTAFSDDSLDQRARAEVGVADFISKEIGSVELRDRVAVVLAKSPAASS